MFLLFFPGLGSGKLVRGIFFIIGDSLSGIQGSLASAALVTPPLVGKGSLASEVLTDDSSSGLQGEFASAYAVGDSSLLESARGIETLLSVLIWGFLLIQLKAALL